MVPRPAWLDTGNTRPALADGSVAGLWCCGLVAARHACHSSSVAVPGSCVCPATRNFTFMAALNLRCPLPLPSDDGTLEAGARIIPFRPKVPEP
jgi:hypothetical protein